VNNTDELAKYRLRNLAKELSHTIVWEASATTAEYSFVSQNAEKVLGYPVQRWLTEPNFWVNLIHPEDRQWTVALSQKAINYSRDYELEYRCLTADRRVIWLRDRAFVIRDEQGQVYKRRGMMVDITLAKQAQAELHIRKRQQTAIAQLGKQAVAGNKISALMDESVALVSQALAVEYCKILEYQPDQKNLQLRAGIGWQEGLVGKAKVEATPATHEGYTLHCRQPIVFEDLRRERRFRGSELLHDHGVVSGMSVVIEAKPEPASSTKPLKRPFGILGAHSNRRRKFSRTDVDFLQAVAYVLATAIAEQQSDQALAEARIKLAQTQAALEKRNQEFEQFAYLTSHDLRAPLRAIANLSQWIEEDIAEQLAQENQHQMQLLRGRVYRLEAMFEGLLEYSRAGRVKTKPDWVDVGVLLQEIIENLAAPADFIIEVAPKMPTIYTERCQLKQVFSHLITNALTHQPSPIGVVTISVKQELDSYEFTVSDNGVGIAPQFQERVFQIFQTLQARDTVENIGTGLAIVTKLVESQGGTIRLDSQLGRGAKFSFTWHELPTEN
jgi:PAS domain S-box-containing protein